MTSALMGSYMRNEAWHVWSDQTVELLWLRLLKKLMLVPDRSVRIHCATSRGWLVGWLEGKVLYIEAYRFNFG